MQSSHDRPLRREIKGAIFDALRAVELEGLAGERSIRSGIDLTDGRFLGAVGAADLWAFDLIDDIDLRPDSGAHLHLPDDGHDPVPVQIVAADDNSVVLSTTWWLPDDLERAQLSLDASFILDALSKRLEDAIGGSGDDGLLEAILVPDLDSEVEFRATVVEATPTFDIEADADRAQTRAAERAIEPGLRFTWGPPGTGKTAVLARAVKLAIDGGSRVLVVAHSNVAVDVAIERIANLVGPEAVDDGRVLRVGTPHSLDEQVRAKVLADEVAARRRPDLAERRELLRRERRKLAGELRSTSDREAAHSAAVRLTEIRQDLSTLEGELRAEVHLALDNADVVATTISRILVDDVVWAWPSDVVIVDEASMVSIPHVLAIASRTESTLSCFGDFRQLPPVALTDEPAALRWMGRDVFESAGVVEAHELGIADDRMTALRTQFRMGESIAATVDDLAYGSMLRTGSAARKSGIRIAELEPAPGAELAIVDTSGFGAFCGASTTGSRFNVMSAALALTVTQLLRHDGCESVGIISPYRAQATILGSATHGVDGVSASTIHRFQGSERDAIIVDLTDGFPRAGVSPLTGADRDLSRRLCNVAVSRARGKLIVIVDRAFLDSVASPDTIPRKLLQIMENFGADSLQPDELIALSTRGDLVEWFDDWGPAVAAAAPLEATGANLPDDTWDGPWIDTIRRSSPDLDLRVGGVGPPLLVGRGGIVAGSTARRGPAALIPGVRVSATVGRLLGETAGSHTWPS